MGDRYHVFCFDSSQPNVWPAGGCFIFPEWPCNVCNGWTTQDGQQNFLIFLELTDLVAKCRRTSWGLRMGGVGCQLLIMQTFPRSRCIFTPAVRILWRYAGPHKHAVQTFNMSQTDFKAKKILSELFSWNYLWCQNLRNFCRFDTFKSHVIISCRIRCKRLVAIRASCGHTCVL